MRFFDGENPLIFAAKARKCLRSIEPFIQWIELWDCDIKDFQMPNGAMAAAGFYQDRSHRPDGNFFSIQFQCSRSFEHDINLRHLFVVMGSRICPDFHLMNAGGSSFDPGKAPARRTAWTWLRRKGIQLFNHIPS